MIGAQLQAIVFVIFFRTVAFGVSFAISALDPGRPHACDGSVRIEWHAGTILRDRSSANRLAETSLSSDSAMDRGIGTVPRIQRNMTAAHICRTPNEFGAIGRNRSRFLPSLQCLYSCIDVSTPPNEGTRRTAAVPTLLDDDVRMLAVAAKQQIRRRGFRRIRGGRHPPGVAGGTTMTPQIRLQLKQSRREKDRLDRDPKSRFPYGADRPSGFRIMRQARRRNSAGHKTAAQNLPLAAHRRVRHIGPTGDVAEWLKAAVC